MRTETLIRTKQCHTCPWRVGSKTENIPNYNRELHENLRCTIAEKGKVTTDGALKIMACHYSKDDEMQHCVGWLHNQIGIGNNIPLRLAMMRYSNANEIEVVGEQHPNFEDTF